MFEDEPQPPAPSAPTRFWWLHTLALQAVIIAATLIRFVDGYPVVIVPVEPLTVASVVAATGSVLLRTRAPWGFLLVIVGLNWLYTLNLPTGDPGYGLLFSIPMAAYAVARHSGRWFAVGSVAAGAGVLVATALLDRGVALINIYPVYVMSTMATALASGQATRTRAALHESTQQRLIEAERTREALAASRVAEQRLTTARDLHDVIGHRISVINLHAGTAQRNVRDDPEAAEASLGIIQHSAETILAEIGDLLSELRTPGDGSPETGLSDLPGLVDTLRAGGFPVEVSIDDDIPPLPRSVDRAAYCILREALVNAYKHGEATPPARLRVTWTGEAIDLLVENSPLRRKRPSRSSGIGLPEIQERAAALGGSAVASSTDGLFQLSVHLPVAPA